MVPGAYAFVIRGNILPEGGLESLENAVWRVHSKDENRTAFFRYKRA